MKQAIPIGIEDYKRLVENEDYLYIDKTMLIKELIDNHENIILLPRPRRFGKTLNISMLKYYFDINLDSGELFSKTKIMQDINHEYYKKYMNKYPIINLNLKGLEAEDFEGYITLLVSKIKYIINVNEHILNKDKIFEEDYETLKRIVEDKYEIEDIYIFLKAMTSALAKYYEEKCIILIDEYDNIMMHAYNKGYYQKIIQFYRNFLGEGLKTNDSLQMGILTGILRISKENIFSGLNNLKVRTILENDYSDKFGFTESEVKCLLDKRDMSEYFEIVKEWYNGYNFGNNTIYNPWSVLNFMANTAKPEAYWLNTSSNLMIYDILKGYEIGSDVFEEVEGLIKGKPVRKRINTNIIFDKTNEEENLWSILLLSGYLKVVEDLGDSYYILTIPNKEVSKIYQETIINYFKVNYEVGINVFKDVYYGLIFGEEKTIKKSIEKVLVNMSIRDRGENFYHGVMLSLLSTAIDHKVVSNVESGKGYLDLALIPCKEGKVGVIIELKRAKEEKDIENLLNSGINQIEAQEYAEIMVKNKVDKVLKYAIVFCKDKVYVKEIVNIVS